MRVQGRYTIWAATSPSRAAAYARGDRIARASLWPAWQTKTTPKESAPPPTSGPPPLGRAMNSTTRALSAASVCSSALASPASISPPATRAHRPPGARPRRPPPHPRVDQQRRVRHGVAHPAHVGGHHGQPGREGLDENLGHPFGQRHMQEDMGAAVVRQQPVTDRNVAEQLRVGPEAAPVQLALQVLQQGALAGDDGRQRGSCSRRRSSTSASSSGFFS